MVSSAFVLPLCFNVPISLPNCTFTDLVFKVSLDIFTLLMDFGLLDPFLPHYICVFVRPSIRFEIDLILSLDCLSSDHLSISLILFASVFVSVTSIENPFHLLCGGCNLTRHVASFLQFFSIPILCFCKLFVYLLTA